MEQTENASAIRSQEPNIEYSTSISVIVHQILEENVKKLRAKKTKKVIKAYQGTKEGSNVVRALWETANHTKDSKAVRKVAELFEQRKLKNNLEDTLIVAEAIAYVAHHTGDSGAVIEVAEMFKELDGIKVAGAIMAAARKGRETVTKVAKELKKYRLKEIAEVVANVIYKIIDQTQNTETAVEVAKKLRNREALEAIMKYQRLDKSDTIAKMLGNVALFTMSSKAVSAVAKEFRECEEFLRAMSKRKQYVIEDLSLKIIYIAEYTRNPAAIGETVKTLKEYRSKKDEAFDKILTELADIAYYTRDDREAVVEAAKTLRKYAGLESATEIARALSVVAYKTGASIVVKIARILRNKEVLEAIKAYQGSKKINTVVETIENMVFSVGTSEAILEVAKTFREYANAGLEDVIEEIAKAIGPFGIRTRAIAEVAEILRNKKVLETIKAYQGSEMISTISEVIGNTARRTRSLKIVRRVAKIIKCYRKAEKAKVAKITDRIEELIKDAENLLEGYRGLEENFYLKP